MSEEIFRPSAQVIKHSLLRCPINGSTKELLTFSGSFHRYILSEFNTHRTFSRNSASSRAIPTHKMIDLVRTANLEPLSWGENTRGMSATQDVTPEVTALGRATWAESRKFAIQCAEYLVSLNIHKQVVNRILEPYLPHTVIFTADRIALQDFFRLRISPGAQPEIREFAIAVRDALCNSRPQELSEGQVHLPFVDKLYSWDEVLNKQFVPDSPESSYGRDEYMYSQPIYNSVATCARYSYLGHEKNQTDENNEKLFWSLHSNGHWSPFEHVAVAMSVNDKLAKAIRRKVLGHASPPRQNFHPAFLQLRKLIEADAKPAKLADTLKST